MSRAPAKKAKSSSAKPEWQQVKIQFNPTPEQLAVIRRTQRVTYLGLGRDGQKKVVFEGLLPGPAYQPAADEWNGAFDAGFVDRALRGDPHVLRVIATAELNLNREAIERTGGALVMRAGRHCHSFDIEVPAWLLAAFVKFHERVALFGYDEAVGREPLTKRSRETLARHAALRRAVSLSLADELYQDPHQPITDLYGIVGEKLGIGKSTCYDIYQEALQEGGYELHALQRFLQAYMKETRRRLPMPSVTDAG
ncbi:hypothetical protein PE066_13675 [Ramlibacter tataouinensis]|uniref:hypothetical protein n=1 Tax=Ramlibacter tataouinensis TaxID=94132 RepID=UPI0022F403F5|nr:hypothetical protein [Ramlibacter tataouinensis]WBY00514.1 hypothetical protein PE066_13675 [Ramlibacter tataouinensis]